MSSREKILLAARKTFGQYGYADTTIKKISEEAGVAFGLIPHYFGSKEKLFVQTSVGVIDEVMARLSKRTALASNGLDAVMHFMEAYLACSVDPNLHFMILARCSPYSDVKIDINKDDIIFKFRELIDCLDGHIARGVEDGSIGKCAPANMAEILFGLIVGSVRTQLMAPYCPLGFYEQVLAFARSSLSRGLR
ncbi:MAG: TetR/AcrR family transcriptional regulator [Desulfovibrionaceae bacterium]|jgi:AcrR family transcriptional regulator|nr:TetR/AcrR family transcriptional regulator [Desulfovibrionaceae bacterium]